MPACGRTILFMRVSLGSRKQMQFPKLALAHGGRGAGHQVYRRRGLREGDHFANRVLVREDRTQPVEPERDAAVRRRTVLERFEEETEAQLLFLGADVEQIEHPALHGGVVDTGAAAA